MRLGIDVGGTNTDAVLMDGRAVIASVKSSTTQDVSSGIIDSVRRLIEQSAVDVKSISHIMIGTTHFVNAFIERKRLHTPMILRIGLPAGRGVPPTSGWPDDLRIQISKHIVQVEGGFQFNGKEISPFDETAVADAARVAARSGIRSVAISCIFSHVDDSMEQRAREIFQQEAPGVAVTLSSEVGRIGMLERENAAIINASLVDLGQEVIAAFRSAFASLAVTAPIYISQNDGTLMTGQHAEQFPVFTFSSGPTNSMRGAAYLSQRSDAIIADIGGTTTDAGVLVNGFPREASLAAGFGGVRTNFRMPDVISSGLGGGSIVRQAGNAMTVGPDSVGYDLGRQARVFGGNVLTTTDIAVAAGCADIGDPAYVRNLSADVVNQGLDAIYSAFADTIDRIKMGEEDIPLVLVGGGSILISRPVSGTSETIVPENAAVANAIGASIAQVSGEIDRVFLYAEHGRDAALAEAKAEAVRRAVEAGADAEKVKVVDILELNLTSMPGDAVRVRVRAVGDLMTTR